MGCGCGKRPPARPIRAGSPDPTGAVIAAARAGGKWRLTTPSGATYDFPTLAGAHDARAKHGGEVSQVRGR